MRDAILVCADELFIACGIRAVTMDMVVSELSISKRTLYEYFSCKKELLAECLRLQLNHSRLLKISGEGLLDELLNLYIGMQRVHLVHVSNFCRELRHYYEPLCKELFGLLLHYAALCSNKVEVGITEGYIRKDVHRNVVCTTISGYLILLFVDTNYVGASIRATLSPESVLILARGLSTMKGRAYIDQKINQIEQWHKS